MNKNPRTVTLLFADRWHDAPPRRCGGRSSPVFEDFIGLAPVWRREGHATGGQNATGASESNGMALSPEITMPSLMAFRGPGAVSQAQRPLVADDFIDLEPVAFQRGIGATRLAGGVCLCVGRTCDGHARSSWVRLDGRGGARSLLSLPLPPRVMDRVGKG